jgi:hypothetical protein
MKFLLSLFLVFNLQLVGHTQSPALKRLEFKRLELENIYKGVGYFDTISGIAPLYDNGKMGYLDTCGKQILPLGSYQTFAFSDGVGVYHDIEQKTFKAIDKSGKVVKEFKNIASLQSFHNGLAVFGVMNETGIRYGVMDFQGNILIKNKYPFIEKISEKYYYVNTNKTGAGVVNLTGDTLVQLKYGTIYLDTFDLHFIGWTTIGYAIFNSSGKIEKYWGKDVYPESSHIEGIPYFQRDSVIIIKNQWSSTNAKTALVNLNLDTIVPMGKYNLSAINEGLVRFYDSVRGNMLDEKVTTLQITKCGFLNTKGEIVIPAKFDFAQYFTEGFSAVRQNNKWGYIDKNGKIVIPLKFDYALPFHHGYAKVQIKDNFYIIDRDGKIVLNSKSY